MQEIIDSFRNVVASNFANFDGRARRSEFWLFHLVFQLLYLLLMVPLIFAIVFATLGGINGMFTSSFIILLLVAVVFLLAFFVLLIPSIAVTARRLHDTGRSGWWMLLGFVPFGTIIVLYFLVLDSDEGANEYGADPKEEERSYYRNLATQDSSKTVMNLEQEGYIKNY